MAKGLTQYNIGLDRISPSKLDEYEMCPKLFYYRSWLGLQIEQDERHMKFGNAIHSAIEQIYLEYDNHFGGGWSMGDFSKVEKKFLKQWTQNYISDESFIKFLQTREGKESGFKDKNELYNYMKNDGVAMLKSYWNNKELMLAMHNHDLTEFEIPMKIEMKNPTNEKDILPIPLSLRLDARNRDKTKIVDFKTSKGRYDVDETRKKIQGQCYVYAELMRTKKIIDAFDYIVLRKGLKTEENRIEVISLKYDMADMVSLFYRIESILKKIANREFDRPLQGHMNFCDCYKYEEKLSIK